MATTEMIKTLYNTSQDRKNIKKNMVRDNVLRKGDYCDGNESYSTTHLNDFKRWELDSQSKIPLHLSTCTNVQLGAIDGGQKFQTTTKSDFTGATPATREEICKISEKSNIVDFDPTYTAVQGLTSEAKPRDNTEDVLAFMKDNNKIIRGKGNPITSYLRATHFVLGSDDPNLKSEAKTAFSGHETNPKASQDAVQRALQDKRSNHVFRQGDYNLTKLEQPKTTFTSSYRGVAGVKTTQEGFDHINTSRPKEEVIKGELARRLYQYLHKNFKNQRDPTQVNLRQAFAFFDKTRTGFISYETLSTVLRRIVEPALHDQIPDVIKEFDYNNDGKIDYLEFERFLNERFQDAPLQESLYGETYKEGGKSTEENILVDAPVDGSYQIKTHFNFGEMVEPAASIYQANYKTPPEGQKLRAEITIPKGAKTILPVDADDLATRTTLHQEQFRGDHDMKLLGLERRQSINVNKSYHTKCSLSFGNDPAIVGETEISSNFRPPTGPIPRAQLCKVDTKYNHCRIDDALPELFTGADMTSEQKDKYNSRVADEGREGFVTDTLTRKSRVIDEHNTHVTFGNGGHDGGLRVSEMAANYQPVDLAHKRAAVPPQVSNLDLSHAAVADLNYSISNTILKEFWDNSKTVKENLANAFKHFDTDNKGSLTIRAILRCCKQLQLPISNDDLRNYIVEMDKNSDGTVDYTEFAGVLEEFLRQLSEHTPASSTTRKDFIPVLERMTKCKPIYSNETTVNFLGGATSQPGRSTMQADYTHPVDKFDHWFQTIRIGK